MTAERCCKLIDKIVVAPVAVKSEEDCGIPDSEMADVLQFDESVSKYPILVLRFCPWCGAPYEMGEGARLTEPAEQREGCEHEGISQERTAYLTGLLHGGWAFIKWMQDNGVTDDESIQQAIADMTKIRMDRFGEGIE